MKIKKIFKITLSCLLILVLGGVIVLFTLPYSIKYFVKDISQIDDSDLRLEEIRIIPEKDNAYFDLIKVKEFIYFPYEKRDVIKSMSNYEQWDQSMVLTNIEYMLKYKHERNENRGRLDQGISSRLIREEISRTF
ncbi:MAG: hypothetical protein BWY21_01155 [Parcubacteria group bacterium ADurb.Bin216]|nr:MAG: hypothetical protein BWY21_01155 [Parcubacteria group bacterium ADurb.Bin216]